MKRKIMCILILFCFFLISCGNGEIKNNKQEIIFIYRRLYYADSFENSGYFIDYDGKRYVFDLSDQSRDYADNEKLYEYLINNMDSFAVEEDLSSEELLECENYLAAIDKNADIEQKSICFDAGNRILLGVVINAEQEPEFILIEQHGEWH